MLSTCRRVVLSPATFNSWHNPSNFGNNVLLCLLVGQQQTANGLGPKEDLPWWETDDCQCKAEACTKPSVTFKSLLMDEVGGTCGRRSWNAGSGQRVLSFSLYGSNPDYWRGLEEILSEVRLTQGFWHKHTHKKHRIEE